MRPCDVAAAFHATHSELTYETARRRVYRAGEKLVNKGVLVRAGGVWLRLTLPAASSPSKPG